MSKTIAEIERNRQRREQFDKFVSDHEIPYEPGKPVDIITFATDKFFCGKSLYLEQRVILKVICNEKLNDEEREVFEYWKEQNYIPKNLEERMDANLTQFREVIMVIGRRGSKTFMSAILAAYTIYKLILLGDPQAYYGIERDKEIFIYCVARSGPQTKQTVFADVKNTILNCPFLQDWIHPDNTGISETELKIQTPADRIREKELLDKGIRPTPLASIRIVSKHSNSSSLRGPAVIFAILSEIAHFVDTSGRLSGEAVYNAVAPAVKQFGKDGMLILESTPWSQTGKFFEQYMTANGTTVGGEDLDFLAYKHMAVFQIATWEMYAFADRVKKRPIMTWEDLESEALTHPDSFWVEYGAVFAATLEAYFDPSLVDAAFDPRLKTKDMGIHKYIYKFHCDPSKSGANFGCIGAHAEKIGESIWKHEFDQTMWDLPLVVVDYIKAYKPSDFKNGQINYIEIENDLIRLGKKFNIDEITFDQWNSVSSIQHVRAGLQKQGKGFVKVREEFATEKKNFDRYENLKAAMLQHRVKCPTGPEGSDAHLLRLELKFLQKKNQRVDKQSGGPVVTKDLADCLTQVVIKLLGDIRDKDFPRAAMGLTPESAMVGGSQSFDQLYRERGIM